MTRRVLLLSSSWSPEVLGGAEVYATSLARHLRSRGDEVGVVTLGVAGPDVVVPLPPRPHRLAVHRQAGAIRQLAFHLADVRYPGLVGRLRRAVAEFRPDVVHSHVVTGMSAAALATPSRLGVPHVHTLHDHWLRCWRSTGTTRGQQPCGPACRAIASVREAQLRRWRPHVLIGISRSILDAHHRFTERVPDARVVLHPADPVPRQQRRATTGAPTFGFIGQLNPNKGLPTLLDAAAVLGAEAQIRVAGRGPLEPQVRGAGDLVEYAGWVTGEAKEAFFAGIDCLVVPSVWEEPAGLVVLEATARGLPVIASNAGGLPEYVPEPCRSLLVPPGDSPALVAAMRRFAADPQRYDVHGVTTRTWADHLVDLDAAYDHAVGLAAQRPSRA